MPVGRPVTRGAVLVGLAANALIRPWVRVYFRLFKFASIYTCSPPWGWWQGIECACEDAQK